MRTLKKNFETSGFTVESMACTISCTCGTCNNCGCYTISDYAGYQSIDKSTLYSADYRSDRADRYNQDYEMNYLG